MLISRVVGARLPDESLGKHGSPVPTPGPLRQPQPAVLAVASCATVAAASSLNREAEPSERHPRSRGRPGCLGCRGGRPAARWRGQSRNSGRLEPSLLMAPRQYGCLRSHGRDGRSFHVFLVCPVASTSSACCIRCQGEPSVRPSARVVQHPRLRQPRKATNIPSSGGSALACLGHSRRPPLSRAPGVHRRNGLLRADEMRSRGARATGTGGIGASGRTATGRAFL